MDFYSFLSPGSIYALSPVSHSWCLSAAISAKVKPVPRKSGTPWSKDRSILDWLESL
jgi:hypothetical protein